MGSTLKLVALVVPMGLDTLGVAIVLGIAGFPPQRRMQLALWFAVFETAMPLVGGALGGPGGGAIESVATYVAAGVIALLGAYVLFSRADEDEGERLLSMTRRGL